MVLKVYSVYDAKIAAYAQPFYMRTQGEAVRGWIDVVNDPKTQFYKYPADFTLFELGEYDEQSGQFTNHPTPLSRGTALEYKSRQDEGIKNDLSAKIVQHMHEQTRNADLS